jgi:hypothetical protein
VVWPQAGIGEVADPNAHQGTTGNGLHWDHLFGLEQALHRRQISRASNKRTIAVIDVIGGRHGPSG